MNWRAEGGGRVGCIPLPSGGFLYYRPDCCR
ncbi:unnamed protein product [Linum tenue]|uniref:Uncharacterized protein n=1 Tax=Linum tenue TaxID=586396 RepID=A0AAV0NV71_9ROSI|nr:unnamed protein product [Linum tenue]